MRVAARRLVLAARARRSRRRARRHRDGRKRPARRNAASRRHPRPRGKRPAARRPAAPTSSRAGPVATRSTPGRATTCVAAVVRRQPRHRLAAERAPTSSTPTSSTPSRATASSSAAASRATRTRTPTRSTRPRSSRTASRSGGRPSRRSRSDAASRVRRTNVGFAVTSDDGATWRSGLLPGLTDASVPAGINARASDPVVAFDARAQHLAHLDARARRRRRRGSRSTARPTDPPGAPRSTPREESGAGGEEGIAFDKNWIACDNTATSPFFGRCYLVYTHSADGDMLAVRWSDDGGLTWSTGVDIGARPAVGVFPAIRPNGDLVVVYLWEAGRFAIAASRSTDGGATWGAAGADRGRRRLVRGSGLPRVPAPVRGRRRDGARLGDVARLRGAGAFAATPSSSRRSPDGATWTRAGRGDARPQRASCPRSGSTPATGRVAIAFMRSGRDRRRHRARRIAGRGAAGARRGDSRRSRCRLAVDAEHDLGTDARRLHLGRTTRAGGRWSSGCSHSTPVGDELSAGGVRDPRLRLPRRSEADRVPDGLQLEEGRDLPRALRVGRRADDALDVLGRGALELGGRGRRRR